LSEVLDVFFVEDNHELRLQMEGMFSELFKNVEIAEHGQIGLEKYKKRLAQKQSAYDLIITDINMPVMNGIEMIHAINEINPM